MPLTPTPVLIPAHTTVGIAYMESIMDNLMTLALAAPTHADVTTMLLGLGAIMLISGLAGAAMAWYTKYLPTTTMYDIDSDIDMVQATGLDPDYVEPHPEVAFFGAMLPEEGLNPEIAARVEWVNDDASAPVDCTDIFAAHKAAGVVLSAEQKAIITEHLFSQPTSARVMFGALEIALPVAKVNVNGCAYNPANGRIIAQKDLPNWTVVTQ